MAQGKGQVQTALQLAGSQHKFQKILIVLVTFLWIHINYLILGPTFIYMDPIFHCASTGDQVIQQSQACPMIHECKLIDTFTITAHMRLFCELEWARDLLQSIFSVGAFVGLLVINMVSDARGRKVALVQLFLVNFVGIIVSFIGAYFNIIFMAITGQFLIGFGAYSMVTIGFTLLSDFLSEAYRSKAIAIINSVWGLATVLLGVFYLIGLRWEYFLLTVLLLPLLVLFYCFYAFIVESPYILMNQNKQQQALFSLTAIAIINNKTQNIDQIRQILYTQQRRDESNQASVKNVIKMVKQWKYLQPILIITIVYGIGSLNFFGIGFAFNVEGYGYGYNSIIVGLIQMVSFVWLGYIITKVPRRKGIAGLNFINLVVGLMFLFPFVHDSKIASTILIGLGRFAGTTSYTMIACLQVQAFTVEIQSTAAGLIEAFSLFGLLLAPLVVDLSDNINIDPIALIAILLNLGIWPLYFLKQTLVTEQTTKVNPLLEGEKYSDEENGENRESRQTMITDFTEKETQGNQ